MNPTCYTLAIHSFAALITNSSTEIYVSADQSTIDSVKALVNNILALGQSSLTCDDLFELSLGEREEGCEDWLSSVDLLVKAKTGTPEAQAAARVLSGLTGLFDIQA